MTNYEWRTRKTLIKEQSSKIDQSSILKFQRDLHRRGNELTQETKKRQKTRKQRKRQEQDRITKTLEQSNVIKANFNQKPVKEDIQALEETTAEESEMAAAEVIEQQKQPEIVEATVVYAVADWNEYVGNDW